MPAPNKDAKLKEAVELTPDAWQRFERAVSVVAKSPPQHRAKAKSEIAPKRALGKATKKGRKR